MRPLYFFIARLLFYRVHNLKEIRRQCAVELSRHKGPWIVCANHLTMIDSFLLTYAIFSFGAYLKDNKNNTVESAGKKQFSEKYLFWPCYVIFPNASRSTAAGPREKTKKMLDKCMYLMRSGQNIMIFPEGGRSRTGRVDKEGFSYGVGRFVQDVEDCKIMCVYMRGDKQATYGFIPAWGEKFYAQMEVFTPERAAAGGLRAQREYAAQIIDKLAQMEESILSCIGNDVVDWKHPANSNKSKDFRYLKKILTSAEIEFVNDSENPGKALWSLWACKETAYKAIRKSYAGLSFLPRQWSVQLNGTIKCLRSVKSSFLA